MVFPVLPLSSMQPSNIGRVRGGSLRRQGFQNEQGLERQRRETAGHAKT